MQQNELVSVPLDLEYPASRSGEPEYSVAEEADQPGQLRVDSEDVTVLCDSQIQSGSSSPSGIPASGSQLCTWLDHESTTSVTEGTVYMCMCVCVCVCVCTSFEVEIQSAVLWYISDIALLSVVYKPHGHPNRFL